MLTPDEVRRRKTTAGRRRRKPKPAPNVPRIVEARSPQEISKAKRRERLPWGVGDGYLGV